MLHRGNHQIDDPFRDGQRRKRDQRADDAERKSARDYDRGSLPYEPQYRRNIS